MTIRRPLLTAAALALALGITTDFVPRAEEPAVEPEIRQVRLDAENWRWIPDKLVVPLGSKVVLTVQSYDATHRFDLKEYGLKVVLPQDQTTTIEFVADKPGTFKWRCGRPCGDGCPRMSGTLVVSETVEVPPPG